VHTARRARPSVGERFHHDIAAGDDLAAELVGRRPRERRLFLSDDRPDMRALAEELLEAIQQVVTLRLRDVEERDDLAVEARRTRRDLSRLRYGVGGIEVVSHAGRLARG